MKKGEATNTFTDGLIKDLNPLTMPNTALSNCLNGTLITYNGTEHVLLNDMGNGKVHSAELPLGFIPLGTTELGGIIYIVSYNPLTGKSQIGSFPSPERNIFEDSDADSLKKPLNCASFYENSESEAVITKTLKLILTDNLQLHAGDKFCITTADLSGLKHGDEPIISALNSTNKDVNEDPQWLKLHIVSILDDGKIIYLDDNLVWYDNKFKDSENNPINYSYYLKYHNSATSPDEYSELINSNYHVFSSKTPGKLAILAELEAVDTFSTVLDYEIKDIEEGKQVVISFLTNWTYNNPNSESRPKVNPESVYFIKEGKEEDDGKAKFEKGSIFKEENGSIKYIRKNDGTDSAVKATNDKLKIPYTPGESNIYTFTTYPLMEYGYLKYLENKTTIDLGFLGSGITELNEYRYFINDNMFTLSYGFNSYPEINKSVVDVTFNFYEFNDTIYKNISESMDNSYVISKDEISTWKTGTDKPTNIEGDTVSIYSFKETSESIMGHFSKLIYYTDALKKDNCYLVKIAINYNNEETRIYYRLLYTSDIFNDEYYTTDDFKKIDLSEKLKVSFNTTTISKLNDSKRTILGEKNQETSKILYIIKGRENIDKIYTVKNEFDNSLDIEIKSTTNSNIFKTEINSANLVSQDVTTDNDSVRLFDIEDDKEISLTPSTSKDDFTPKIEDGAIKTSGNLNTTVNTQIKFLYNKDDSIIPEFELVSFNGSYYYCSFLGADNNLGCIINTTRFDDLHSPRVDTNNYGGDGAQIDFNSFDSFDAIGNFLRNELKSKDYVALCVNVAYLRNRMDQNRLELGNKVNYTRLYITLNTINYDMGACYILYAFNTNSGILVIAFPKQNFGAIIPNEYPGFNRGGNENKQVRLLNLLAGNGFEVISSNVERFMKNYYKPTIYNGTSIPAKSIGNRVYWSNFEIFTKLNLKYNNIKLNYFINGVNLINDTKVNNLNLPSNLEFNFSKTVNNYIDINSVLQLANLNSTESYVVVEGKTEPVPVEKGLSMKSIYNIEATPLNTLLASDDFNANPTTILINFINNQVVILDKLAEKVALVAYLNDLLIKVNNIALASPI